MKESQVSRNSCAIYCNYLINCISKEYQFHQNTFKLEVLVIISYYFNLVLVFLTFMTRLLLKWTCTSSDGTWSHQIFVCLPKRRQTMLWCQTAQYYWLLWSYTSTMRQYNWESKKTNISMMPQSSFVLTASTIKVCDVSALFGTILESKHQNLRTLRHPTNDPFWLNNLLMCLIGQVWRLRNDHLQ